MTIHKKSTDRFIVELTQEDMENYHITYESLNVCDNATKSIINDVCRLIKLNLVGVKTLIDAIPSDDGGCFLLITAFENIFEADELYLFTFDNINNVIDFRNVFRDILDEPVLYRDGTTYFIVLRTTPTLIPRMSEFCEITTVDEAACAYADEHFERLGNLLKQ